MQIIILIITTLIILSIILYKHFTKPLLINKRTILQNRNIQNIEKQENYKYYQISQNDSYVKFTINEVLAGKPFVAIGINKDIYGDIVLDKYLTKIGLYKHELLLDARNFITDNKKRDAAITRFILGSLKKENNYISFKTNEYDYFNLKENEDGTYTSNISGILKISNVNKNIDLPINIFINEKEIKLNFRTIIKRSDFKISIPKVPFVADVEDNLIVEGYITAYKI